MREIMNKFRELVRDRAQDKKHGQQNGDSVAATRKEADWEMSSDDALRAPIVSGYK